MSPPGERRHREVSRSWRGLVVFCAGTSWDGTRGSDRHLATALSKHVPVLWVDPAVSALTPLRHRHARGARHDLHVVAPNLARVTPVALPGVSRPLLRDVAARVSRQTIRRAAAALGGDVRAVVAASLDDVFGACPKAQRVVYATDDFSAAGELMGLSPRWLRAQEQARREEVTDVIAVSEPVAQRWRRTTARVSVVPNGVAVDAYVGVETSTPAHDVRLTGPTVGFVGQLSQRIDLRLLEAVAATGVSLLMVGPRQSTFDLSSMAELLDRPNVQWVGPRPFESLPSYLRLMSVGITPYVVSDFNTGSSPLKTLEYLAAGRRAVVTDLPAARELHTELVAIRTDPGGFAQTAASWAHVDPTASAADCRAFAQAHSWDARAAQVRAALGW